jgi:cell division protein FtsB
MADAVVRKGCAGLRMICEDHCNSLIFSFRYCFGFVKDPFHVSKPRKKATSKVTRLQAQTRVIRIFNGLILCLFGLSLGLVAVATALPQKRKLDEKEMEYAQVLARESEVLALKEDKAAAYEALREDPEYLEIHARDRLPLHKDGESIYRIERNR